METIDRQPPPHIRMGGEDPASGGLGRDSASLPAGETRVSRATPEETNQR